MAVPWEGGEEKRTPSKKCFIGNWVSSTTPSPPTPQHLVRQVMMFSFGWSPCSSYPENAWGLLSKPTQLQHNWQGCYEQFKVKEKGEKKKERKKNTGKISLLLKTKESSNERLTGRSLRKYNLSKENIRCLLTCENFLIQAIHVRTHFEFFFF